jgi:transposase
MSRRKQGKARQRPVKGSALDVLAQVNLNTAGLDIGDNEIYAAVPEGRDASSVRAFPTFTVNLHALADWLEACGVTSVVMESTGIYWIPIYEILEARGLQVLVVNARHLKQVSGRKSDILDCQWLQQLHTYGLLRGSFRPEADICTLRTLTRQRESLVRQRASHILHMQKALHLMNLQLDNVLGDLSGKTGMAIVRDILAGERDPQRLAAHRDFRCKRSQDEIAKSLHGSYKDEHLFVLRQAVEAYDFYTGQIQACNQAMAQVYARFEPQIDPIAHPLAPQRTKGVKDTDPTFDLRSQLYQLAGVDLTAIDGFQSILVQTLLAEIGLDMSRWPTVKHFASWLGLAPNNKVSGGKVLSRSTPKVLSPANRAFRQAALSVAKTHSALGAFYRRQCARHGPAFAVVATAHKLARIVYFMLKTRSPYHDEGGPAYEQRQRQRSFNQLKRKAKDLGFSLTPLAANLDAQVS